MGQGTSSTGPMDVSRGPCPRPLGASALSPAGPSCSRLDPSSRLWVSGLEPAAAAKSAPEMAAEGSGARSSPGHKRAAWLQQLSMMTAAAEMPIVVEVDAVHQGLATGLASKESLVPAGPLSCPGRKHSVFPWPQALPALPGGGAGWSEAAPPSWLFHSNPTSTAHSPRAPKLGFS